MGLRGTLIRMVGWRSRSSALHAARKRTSPVNRPVTRSPSPAAPAASPGSDPLVPGAPDAGAKTCNPSPWRSSRSREGPSCPLSASAPFTFAQPAMSRRSIDGTADDPARSSPTIFPPTRSSRAPSASPARSSPGRPVVRPGATGRASSTSNLSIATASAAQSTIAWSGVSRKPASEANTTMFSSKLFA